MISLRVRLHPFHMHMSNDCIYIGDFSLQLNRMMMNGVEMPKEKNVSLLFLSIESILTDHRNGRSPDHKRAISNVEIELRTIHSVSPNRMTR